MFSGCTSLTTAPALRAPTLVDGCYYSMFQGCSNLNYVECLATKPGGIDTGHWLDDVASTGTFVKAAGVTWPSDYKGIPEGWTVVEK